MRKLLTWTVLGLFVLVVPFGSWYYLKMGLDYRKQAAKDLIRKDSLDVSSDTLNLFRRKTTILINNNQGVTPLMIEGLKKQFEKTDGFQVVFRDSLPLGYFSQVFDKYSDKNFMLIDTGSYIRNVYKADADQFKMLIQHTAITLPRLKEVDIKMQKDANK